MAAPQTSEKRQTESLANTVDRPDSRVQSVGEKHDDQCEDETEAEGDQAVSHRAGANLGRPVSLPDDLRRWRLRRLELPLVVGERVRVFGRKLHRKARIRVLDRERE